MAGVADTTPLASNGGPLRVFISYSRSDLPFVLRLQGELTAHGAEVSIDREGIEKSEEWWPRIKQLIAEASAFVFAISPGSVASPICLDELAVAVSAHKRLIPIVVDDVSGELIPPALARLNYIYFPKNHGDGDATAFRDAIDQLIRTLTTDIVWIREHTRLGLLAIRWNERGRPSAMLLRGAELKVAEAWLLTAGPHSPDPTDLHRAFIVTSRRVYARNRKIDVATTLLLAVIVASLGILAYRQKRNVARTLSAGLLAKANEDIRNGHVPEATVLAAEAVKKDPQNWAAYATAFEGLARLRYRLRYAREWCNHKDFLAVSGDGTQVATVETRGNNDAFIVEIEQIATGRYAARIELHEYPSAGIFSQDGRYLFVVGTTISVIDLTRGVLQATLAAKTNEYLNEKCLLDPDPDYFWTVNFGAIHRFDMKRRMYDRTVVQYQQLHSYDFRGTLPARIARRSDGKYVALAISGQSEDYTGEADDTGRIFLFDRTMTHAIAMINSGLISDMTFGETDGDANALYVAKPGGIIERWLLPAEIQGATNNGELPELKDKEVVVSGREINFYAMDPDPADSEKTQILPLGAHLAAFTSGRLALIDVKSGKQIDSGLFDNREVDFFSDAFRIVKLTSAFATVSQNSITEPRTQCGRLNVWDVVAGKYEAIDLRDVFSRTFQKRRRTESIFEDMGATGDWKIKALDGSHTRMAYLSQEADTRYSTRYVLNMVDIDGNGSELVASHHLAESVCGRSRALVATHEEVCAICRDDAEPPAAVCLEWSGVPKLRALGVAEIDSIARPSPRPPSRAELLMSRVVASVGGTKLESAADGSVLVFQKGHTPVLWRGTDILCGPVDEIRTKAMALTGLRVTDGLAVEVNATRFMQ